MRFVPVCLDCDDELALARSWRTGSSPGWRRRRRPPWPGSSASPSPAPQPLYPLGLASTALGLAYSGPLRPNLIRDQEQPVREGCAISPVPALRHAITSDW